MPVAASSIPFEPDTSIPFEPDKPIPFEPDASHESNAASGIEEPTFSGVSRDVSRFKDVMAFQTPQLVSRAATPFLNITAEQQAQALAKVPTMTAQEAEQVATTPFAKLPRIGEPGTISRGVSDVVAGALEQSLMTPAAPVIDLSLAIPGVRVVAGTVLTAAAAKSAATELGEASVTGNREQAARGTTTALLAGLGAVGLARDAMPKPEPSLAPASAEAAKASQEALKHVVAPAKEGQVGVLQSGEKPLGIISPLSLSFNNVLNFLSGKTADAKLFLRGAAGESLPRMSEANPPAAEAGISYASAPEAAPLKAELFVEQALEGTDISPAVMGAALTEANLRSVAKQRIAAGENPADVAASVKSIIGLRGSPFPDEASYQRFIADPITRQAVEQYKQVWEEQKEPMYKLAASIDPDTPLPTRGEDMGGARINLFPIKEGEPVPEVGAIAGGGGGGNLLATLRRKSPFARKAMGTGDQYVIDLRDIMANSFRREFAIAMKNKMDDALVANGDAAVLAVGKEAPNLKGEAAEHFPYRNLALVGDEGQIIPVSRTLWIRKSLAGEYRALAGTDKPLEIPIITKGLGGPLTKAALQGLSEGTIHLSNLFTALFTRPGPVKNLVLDSLLKVHGRADVPVTLAKVVMNAFSKNKQQLVDLAEIGALKPAYRGSLLGPFLTKVDLAVRRTLDDTYQGLKEQGLVEDSPRARREYINQVGQYNKRLQGPLMRALRESQVGPFATAGRAFNVLGYRTMVLSPGVKSLSPLKAAMLRADVLAGWIGLGVFLAAWNLTRTGSVVGTPGTKIGDMDLGVDEKGHHKVFPLADLLGYGRAMRVTGIRGYVESRRLGLSNANSIEAGLEAAASASANPAIGPLPKAAITTVTGKRASMPIVQEAPVIPPGSSMPQMAQNAAYVALEANPIVASIYEASQGRKPSEIVQRQLTRFAPREAPSADLVAAIPRIREKQQMEDYVSDIGKRARRLTPEAAQKLFDTAYDAVDEIEDTKLRREARRMLRARERYTQ